MFVQSFDDAAQFLARALPWPTAGEANWFVNIHYGFVPPGGTRPLFPGRACTSVKEAVSCIQWAMTLPKSDIYACMSAQSEATQRTGKTGKPWMAAKRLAANAIWHKSLFVDVDVKDGAYASTAEAASEFGRIRREIGLPPPSMAVLSGSGGFHAHWIFVEPIRGLRFLTLAHAFVNALQSKGFKGDTGVSIDGARLLRIPNTLNWKHNPPKPVKVGTNSGNDYLVETLENILLPYGGIVTTKMAGPQTLTNMPTLLISNKFKTSKLAGTDLMEGLAPTLPLAAVEQVCPWVADTVATGGRDNWNPLWLASTNLSLFVADSRAACHAMAKGHATYDVNETDNLFDRQEITKVTRNLGWPKCQSIHGVGAPQCATCPNLALGKSPLNFAQLVQPAPAPSPPVTSVVTPPASPTTLPDGYVYGTNPGIVCKVEADENGVQHVIPITERPMMNAWLQENPRTLHFDTVASAGKTATLVSVPENIVGNYEKWSSHCTDQGLFIQLKHRKEVMTFHSSWISKLKDDRLATLNTVPFGWLIEDGVRKGFVYGGYVWSSNLATPSQPPEKGMAIYYTPKGTIAPYLAAVQMLVDQKRPAIDAILAVSYAAPLVHLIGQSGLILSVFSQESGIQKSTALKINASVWGHPVKSMQSLQDTHNAVVKKMGMLRHLPIVWDELRSDGDDAKKFSDLVFQASLGKEKARLKATTEFQTMGDWATIMVGASNDSLLAQINKANRTTEAGMMRIFEYVVPRATQGIISTADATMMVSLLDDNYGSAGLLYAQFLGANHEDIVKELQACLKDMEQAYSAKPEERYWLATMACLRMGAQYANEVVGTDLDLTALSQFLADALRDMRRSKVDATVDLKDPANLLDVLSRYLNHKETNHMLVTDRVVQGNTNQTAQVLSPIHLLNELQVHLAKDGHLRLRVEPFVFWLQQQGISSTVVLNELKRQLGATETKNTRLGMGTPRAAFAERCLTFNWLSNPFPAGWR